MGPVSPGHPPATNRAPNTTSLTLTYRESLGRICIRGLTSGLLWTPTRGLMDEVGPPCHPAYPRPKSLPFLQPRALPKNKAEKNNKSHSISASSANLPSPVALTGGP